MSFEYEDILHAARPSSPRHPPMSRENRAAQFAPFAALVGYDDAVKETARLTSDRIHLDDCETQELDRRLRLLDELMRYRPYVRIRYFKQDAKKAGGCYLTYEGSVIKLDKQEQLLFTEGGTKIAFPDIFSIEGECFGDEEWGCCT